MGAPRSRKALGYLKIEGRSQRLRKDHPSKSDHWHLLRSYGDPIRDHNDKWLIIGEFWNTWKKWPTLLQGWGSQPCMFLARTISYGKLNVLGWTSSITPDDGRGLMMDSSITLLMMDEAEIMQNITKKHKILRKS